MDKQSVDLFSAVVPRTSTIRHAMTQMGASPRNKYRPGLVVVVDEQDHVVAVVTDGDIRRGVASGASLDDSIKEIANFHPLMLPAEASRRDQMRLFEEALLSRKKDRSHFSRVILVKKDGTLGDVVDTSFLYQSEDQERVVAIYGMGFVGLTLAVSLASTGIKVIGIEINDDVCNLLQQGKAPFFENGLESMLNSPLVKQNLIFKTNLRSHEADTHIVAVGTPINEDRQPDLSSMLEVCTTISTNLKKNDLVIFRSTLPMGVTRNILVPVLQSSGLTAGADFSVAFAPERTVEGNALEELKTLPQIIGGWNDQSLRDAVSLFRQLTNVVEVESLEAAELAKLMNNTFRDLTFAFSNEVAAICDAANINAFRLINAVNNGYVREKIALPSPGVGGPCLSKDPYLYSYPSTSLEVRPQLGVVGREINSRGGEYIVQKLMQFCDREEFELHKLKILVVGLAFKGQPETSDIRDSISLSLIDLLPRKSNIRVIDFVVPHNVIRSLGVEPAVNSLEHEVTHADIAVFCNNHYGNNRFDIVRALQSSRKKKLIFDGWNQFDQLEVESFANVTYATMGYMTSR